MCIFADSKYDENYDVKVLDKMKVQIESERRKVEQIV